MVRRLLPDRNTELLLRLDETSGVTAYDVTGKPSPHNGVITGAIPTAVAGMPFTSALRFSSNAHLVSVAAHADFKAVSYSSLAFFVYFDSFTGAQQHLFNVIDGTDEQGPVVLLNTSNAWDYILDTAVGNEQLTPSFAAPAAGRWYFIECTFDGTNMRFLKYDFVTRAWERDELEVTSPPTTISFGSGTVSPHIGNYPGGGVGARCRMADVLFNSYPRPVWKTYKTIYAQTDLAGGLK